MSRSPGQPSVGEKVLASSLWIGSWRWSARLVGLITTIIVARLLLPDDFGVFATGVIIVSLFDILIDLGTDHYLIRMEDPGRDDYDTAWTLRLILTAAAAGIIIVTAAAMASLFDDARLIHIVQVLAAANLFRGFVNIGLTMYRRELRYDRIAAVGIAQRLVAAVTTVGLAFALESYWALVLGEVALRIAELVLSYVVHPYRPRFTVCRFGEQWDFSKWLVVRNLATFLQGRGDQIVIAKFFGMQDIGLYTMAARFARIPTSQLADPMLSPVYSGLATKQANPAQLRDGIVQVVGITCLVVLPAAAFCAAVGEELLVLVLGQQWAPAGPLVVPLLVAAMFTVVYQPVSGALTLTGRVRLVAVLGWVAAISIVFATIVAARLGHLETLAYVRAALTAGLMVVYFGIAAAVLAIPWRRLLAAAYRPVTAGVASGYAAHAVSETVVAPAAGIAAALAAAAITYLVTLYALWRAATSPDAGETLLLRKAWTLLHRRTARGHPVGRGR